MNKFYPLALSAMLGIGAFAVSGGSASAVVIPAVQLGGSVNTSDNVLLQEVQNKRSERRWDRQRHGDRFRNRRDSYRHFYDGYYYNSPWWTLEVPLAVYDDDDEWSDDHVQWCSEQYRSYNLDDITWVSFSGQVRECNSPF